MTVNTKEIKGTGPSTTGYPEQYQDYLFIDIKPLIGKNGQADIKDATGSTWAWVSGGISNIDEARNDTTDSTAYMDGHGFTDNNVTGSDVSYSVTGNRKMGDAFQEYLRSIADSHGTYRNTRMIYVDADRTHTIIAQCTISNPKLNGAAANAKKGISFTIQRNNAPREIDGVLTMNATADDPYIFNATVTAATGSDEPKAVVNEDAATNPTGTDATPLTKNSGTGTTTEGDK